MPKPEIRCIYNGRDQLGETPLWCAKTQRIWWLDIEKPKLQCFDEATGRHEVYPFDTDFAGSIAFHAEGGFVLALGASLHRFQPEDGSLTPIAEIEPAAANTRLNDGRCDRQGRLWIGTMDNGLTQPKGSLYRVDPDGTATRMFGDVIVTNSIAVSPDGRTLYFSDTRRYLLWAFDLDPDDGTLSNRRVFADYAPGPGRPDGACVDADGCLWNAVFAGGRVVRYTPEGKIDRVIEMPVTHPTCVTFGGPDLSTLYVTTASKALAPEVLAAEPLAGALLALETDVEGFAEAGFGKS